MSASESECYMILDTYTTSDGDLFTVTEDYEDGTYGLQQQTVMFGEEVVLGQGYKHKEDAEQMAVGIFEELGEDELINEVLSE